MQEMTTEQTIIQAANKIFLENGYAGTRMQDIADEAKINKAMLHDYFKNKESLFRIIFLENFGLLIPLINQVIEAKTSIKEKLLNIAELYIDLMQSNPKLPLFVINELSNHSDSFIAAIKDSQNELPNFKQLIQEVKDAVKKKEIAPIDPELLIVGVLALSIFPVIAKQMLQILFSENDKSMDDILQRRKAFINDFIQKYISN